MDFTGTMAVSFWSLIQFNLNLVKERTEIGAKHLKNEYKKLHQDSFH